MYWIKCKNGLNVDWMKCKNGLNVDGGLSLVNGLVSGL